MSVEEFKTFSEPVQIALIIGVVVVICFFLYIGYRILNDR